MIGYLNLNIELKNGETFVRKVELEDINQYWDGLILDKDLITDIDMDTIEDISVEETA